MYQTKKYVSLRYIWNEKEHAIPDEEEVINVTRIVNSFLNVSQ